MLTKAGRHCGSAHIDRVFLVIQDDQFTGLPRRNRWLLTERHAAGFEEGGYRVDTS